MIICCAAGCLCSAARLVPLIFTRFFCAASKIDTIKLMKSVIKVRAKQQTRVEELIVREEAGAIEDVVTLELHSKIVRLGDYRRTRSCLSTIATIRSVHRTSKFTIIILFTIAFLGPSYDSC